MRSVSLILRLCSPVNRKGTSSSAQVTTNVCARSGMSTKSSSSRLTQLPFFLSRMPSSVYSVSIPSRANTSAPRLSPDSCGGTVRSVQYPLRKTRQPSDTSRGCAPVALYSKRDAAVRLWLDRDALVRRPPGRCTEVLHQLQGQVDIRARDDLTCQPELQTVFRIGPIISKAEMYCELTLPFNVISLPASGAPSIRRAKPSLRVYSILAPSSVRRSPISVWGAAASVPSR